MLKFFLGALGLALIIEGIPYFAFPERAKIILGMVSGMRPRVLRGMGLAVMLLGLLVLVLAGSLLTAG